MKVANNTNNGTTDGIKPRVVKEIEITIAVNNTDVTPLPELNGRNLWDTVHVNTVTTVRRIMKNASNAYD